MRLLNRWVLVPLFTLLVLCAFFWRDVAEQTADEVQAFMASTPRPAEATLDRLNLSTIGRGRSANDATQLVVSDLRFETRSADESVVSVQMTRHSSNNVGSAEAAVSNYPHVILVMKSAEGLPLRRIDLAPSQYEHGTALSDERIRFNLDVEGGERRIFVVPEYPTEQSYP